MRSGAGYPPASIRVSKKRLYLTEMVPAGPKARKEAERACPRMLSQVDERRSPRTRATLGLLLDKSLEVLDVDPSTRRGYANNIRKHIPPSLGSLSLTRLDVQTLDSFYAELRRCRDHCNGRQHQQHRTTDEHKCDEHVGETCSPPNRANCRACRRACQRYVCRGLATSTVRQMRWIIRGALDRGVVWEWIAVNPAQHAKSHLSPTLSRRLRRHRRPLAWSIAPGLPIQIWTPWSEPTWQPEPDEARYAGFAGRIST